MADNFQGCLTFVLKEEGGWADNPNDPGGCTMHGITLPAFRQWKHDHTITCAQLYVVSLPDVTNFYREQYWLPTHAEQLPAGVDLMVMDAAVNMGVGRSVRLLQEQVGAVVDGQFGPSTFSAVLAIEPAILIDGLAAAQIEFYRGLNDFAIFGTGWINRSNRRHANAIIMNKMS